MSREYTTEEIREKFLEHIRVLVNYCENESRAESSKEKLDGLAFSILSAIDGCSGALPSFVLSPISTDEHVEFYKEEGENYYSVDKELQDKLKCDIGGGLHDFFYKK